MCGIIGHIGRNGGEHAQEFIMNQYEDQQSRGGKGFGVISADKHNVTIRRSTGETKALIDVARTCDPVIIFHHRFPTSTENTRDQTHPMEVSHSELKYDYLIVHNGVISNSHELFKRHTEELGYAYRTYQHENTSKSTYGYAYHYSKFNDSESLAIEIARFLEKKEETINTRGSAAFMGLKLKKGTKRAVSVFWGSNGGNPLDFMETKDGLLLASELGADAFMTDKNEFYELSFKDLFDPKKADKPLMDLVDMSTLVFAPPLPPVSHQYVNSPSTLVKVDGDTPPVGVKVDKPKELDLKAKEPPTGYTNLEWAIHKAAMRQMEKIQETVLNHADYLAMYLQNPDPDTGQPDYSDAYKPEDLLDDTMTILEDQLNELDERIYRIAEWVEDEEDFTDYNDPDAPPKTHPSYLDPVDFSSPSKTKTLATKPLTHATPLIESPVSRDDFTLF